MGALRKAGVWLGLVEDDGYAEGFDPSEYDDFDEEVDQPVLPLRARGADRNGDPHREPMPEPSRDHGTVRPITTRSGGIGTAGLGTGVVGAYPTRDSLALAPQVHPHDRVPIDELAPRYQITTLHPTTYNEARTIGEHFRDGVPVIMNLTEMAEADAKRLVDFAAGLAFGLRGSMDRVTNRVFLLTPANVQVTAEDKARIAEGGFFNQS